MQQNLLADTGSNAGSFATSASAYSITGLPSTTGNSLEIQKSNGATDIAVWNEPAIWNASTGTEVGAATQNATVNLGATYQTVKVFDPLSGTSPVETLSNVSSVSLGLTDHPLIIETESQSMTTAGSGGTPPGSGGTTTGSGGTTTGGSTSSDTLTLNMSEDAYKGDAQFTVKVNGQQVGGTYSASALHSSGDAGTVQLTGDWGTGSKNVDVSFIIDAYAGSPSTDRNLYVNSIQDNGVSYAGTSATMMSNGSQSFTVGGATPTAASPKDNLTLTLSEDAYKGDAQFVLYIDGKAITSPQVVSALHDANSTERFAFSGNLGAGQHTIGVAFVNDAWAGTPTTDRNLYINGVTMNGSSVFSGIHAQDSNGTANFAVTTTA